MASEAAAKSQPPRYLGAFGSSGRARGEGTIRRTEGKRAERPERPSIDVQTAKENRALAVGLGGTCLAILTFLLFFLYPRWVSGEVNPVLFRGTLAGIVLCLFLFVYAALFYYWFLICHWNNDPRGDTYFERGDRFVMLGLILLVVEPAFILFTINLVDLASSHWAFGSC